MNEILIGLDLGTTLAKCAAYDTAGNELAAAVKPFPTNRRIENGAEQNPQDWTDALCAAMRDVSKRLGADTRRIAAIGVSAHGPGIVLVDEGGVPLLPCAIWQDNRCAPDGLRLFEEIGYDWVGQGMPQTGFAARLKWLSRTQPEALAEAIHIQDIKGYILWFLTGQYVTEPSSSAGGPAWNSDMLHAAGIAPGRMDAIIPSTAAAGRLRAPLADAIGFPRTTSVISGLNDGATAMLGSGTVGVGKGVISVSTNGIARIVVAEKLPGKYLYDHSMFCWPYVDGSYVAGGFTKSAGDTIEWWLDTAYRDTAKTDRLPLINAEAEKSGPGARGVRFYPWLLGRGSPAATDTPAGGFLNMARSHTRGDMSRAVFEGVAFALRDIAGQFRVMGYPFKDVRLTGGGMKSSLWREIVCHTLQIEGQRVQADSLLGAAMLAGVGVGVYKSVDEACKACVRLVDVPLPLSGELIRQYSELYCGYVRVKGCLQEYAEIMEGVSI